MHVNEREHSKFNSPKNVLNILNKDIFMIPKNEYDCSSIKFKDSAQI